MLKGYKTYITAGLAILTAAATYLTGEATLGEALQLGFGAIMAGTIRKGIKADLAG
jgi:hypothetical protein